jgi:type I restriction-modification system DNA methylase subunit
MIYSYDRLWKRLTDKNITNSEISRMANISAHTLSKMQKNEPITLDNLAKIATVLNCSFDDIIEFSDEMYGISNATMKNWKKLNTNSSDRLTSRANKRRSPKRILPYEYFSNEGNIPFTQKILDIIDSQSLDILPSIFSLGINLLKKAGLYNKSHVSAVLADYSDITVIPELVAIDIPDDEYDILGLIYQSYQREGEKNIAGSYYTPQQVAYNMTCSFNFSDNQKFLDPCCGSGAFLLSVPAKNPLQIFGIDNDETAVLIAKINLLLKYSEYEFIPQIYCFDYLSNDTNALRSSILNTEFDYIATNPPWGAMGHNNVISNRITSEESFSLFFVKSFEQLKANGTIRFLFPESILNVKAHKDIRQYILENTKLVSITKYNDVFSGVTTNYIDIECINASKSDHFMVYSGTETRSVSVSSIYETDNLIFNLLSDDDISIIHKIKDKGNYYLKDSTWALGIVTGDNKNKLIKIPKEFTQAKKFSHIY